MSVKKQSKTHSDILTTDERIVLEKLDQSLQKLSNKVLPPQPYLVKAPTDKPWLPGSRQLPKWYAGTPFSKDEEPLQYLSFIPYYREYLGEEIIIVSEGGWSDEKGNILQEGVQPEQPEQQQKVRPTGDVGGQRKKITLSAYKNKVRGGSEEATSDMERAQATIRKADDGLKQKQKEPQKSQPNGIGQDIVVETKKRPREETVSSTGSIAERRERSPRPEKKARPSPPPVQKQPAKSIPNRRSPPPREPIFPSLESPTLPPSLDIGDDITLPPLESPTLPPDLEKLLARRLEPVKPLPNGGLEKKRADSVASGRANRDSDLSPAPKVRVRNADSPLVNPQSSRSTPKVTPDKKSDSSLARKAHAETSKARSHASSTASEKVKLFPGLSRAEVVKEKEREPERVAPRLKLVVKLRYGKQNRKRVEQLLRLQPRAPKKAPAATSAASPAVSTSKGDVQDRMGKEPSPRPEKRRRFEEGETSTARKTPSSLNLSDKPRTPLAPPFPSPGVQYSIPKSTFSTPKKDLKPPAMQRVQSSDAPLEARTPPGGSRVNTPQGTDRTTPQNGNSIRTSPPTSTPMTRSVSSDPQETRRAWRAVYLKYHELGRKLKHQAQTILNEKRPAPDSPDGKLHVALLTEALLCFVLAIYCLDRGSNPGHADNGWRSTLPFWEMVRSFTKTHADLGGLVLHLGVLVRNMVHRNDIERLARDPLPSESSTAPTPGSDGTAKIPSEEEKYRKQYLGFKADLVDNFRQLNSLMPDASRRLSAERVERKFASTWSRRRITTDLEREKSLQPDASLAGDYPFPINVSTTPLEGVRLGRRFLKEWCRIENVNWTARLEL